MLLRSVCVAAAVALAAPALADDEPTELPPADDGRDGTAGDIAGQVLSYTGFGVGVAGLGIAGFGSWVISEGFEEGEIGGVFLVIFGGVIVAFGHLAFTGGAIIQSVGGVVRAHSLQDAGSDLGLTLPYVALGLAIAGGVIGLVSPSFGEIAAREGDYNGWAFAGGLFVAGGCLIASYVLGIVGMVQHGVERDRLRTAWTPPPVMIAPYFTRHQGGVAMTMRF